MRCVPSICNTPAAEPCHNLLAPPTALLAKPWLRRTGQAEGSGRQLLGVLTWSQSFAGRACLVVQKSKWACSQGDVGRGVKESHALGLLPDPAAARLAVLCKGRGSVT